MMPLEQTSYFSCVFQGQQLLHLVNGVLPEIANGKISKIAVKTPEEVSSVDDHTLSVLGSFVMRCRRKPEPCCLSVYHVRNGSDQELMMIILFHFPIPQKELP
jgi:hypothetical protein